MPSTDSIRAQTPRRESLGDREKVDQVMHILREDYSWSVDDFVDCWIRKGSTATDSNSHLRTPRARRSRLFTRFEFDLHNLLEQTPSRRKIALQSVAAWTRRELERLIREPEEDLSSANSESPSPKTYFGTWKLSEGVEALSIKKIYGQLEDQAPNLTVYLETITAHRHAARDSRPMRSKEGPALKIFFIISLITRLYASTISNHLATLLGLHLQMLGTKKRGLQLLSKMGVCISPSSIASRMGEIADDSKASLASLSIAGLED